MTTIPDNDPVVLETYNPDWPSQYEKESSAIQKALGDTIIDIQHIGTTSVPGLAGKPVIDIQIVVDSMKDTSGLLDKLMTLGYVRKSADINNSELFFCKTKTDQLHTHHLHIVEAGSDEQERQIVFRDYLRANPRGAQEYDALKQAMAAKFADDRSAYVDAKTAFITLALALYKTNPA